MRKGVWFEVLLDRCGLGEEVVERVVSERLGQGQLYTPSTGTIPLSFHAVTSENGTSAILLCFTNENAEAAAKAVSELQNSLQDEIRELARLKERLQVLKSDREIFARNGIEVV
ncbi:MAG: hypothetical protein XD48_0075 [Archaeoglobus fulgidus]|jgi:capsular polysaccharide biosynthesis protein|uniref:Uncharacterized protein n=1 Tax=Archaeoglobus fulgidus TaxID=2234 RepID=A0A101E3P0_ARCFL|nr:MAG: hypothetical protein XD48_0075 [Archaeoglobus fulgidus]